MKNLDTLQAPRRLIENLRDRYVFLSILGRGGSGTVFEVKNVNLGRVEALKALTNTMSVETTRRFTHEAKVSAMLDHPGIVKVYDFGQADDINWYSMQLIEGPSLSTLIEEGIRLDPVAFSRLAIPLLEALAFSHEQGVIHRDIKPGNIMLHKSGRPCLTDFGIAKSPDTGDFTQTGNMVGTPAYMSPEQAEGKRVDGRTDQYSLAITLYRAVSGRLPFSSLGTLETLVQRLKEDPDPLEWYCPDFPAPLRHILMKALSRSKEDRYKTATDMQNALQRACEASHIQWGGPIEGYEHLSAITRKPIESHDLDFYDDVGATASMRSNTKTLHGESKKSFWMAFIAVSLAVIAVSLVGGFVIFASRKSSQEASASHDATPQIEDSPTQAPNNNPRPKPQIAPPPPPVIIRKPVSPPRQLDDPDAQVVVPPGLELEGRLIRVKVKVGEDGRVQECAVLDRDITPDQKAFIIAFAKKVKFSPALDADGEPVVSDFSFAIPF